MASEKNVKGSVLVGEPLVHPYTCPGMRTCPRTRMCEPAHACACAREKGLNTGKKEDLNTNCCEKHKKFDKKHLLCFDGACWPNPGGEMGMGWHLRDDEGTLIDQGSHAIHAKNGNTCNVAEYIALIGGLTACLRHNLGDNEVLVRGDSEFVIMQMRRIYRINAGKPYSLYAFGALELLRDFSHIRFEWIPREKNGEADKLSREKMVTAVPENPKKVYTFA